MSLRIPKLTANDADGMDALLRTFGEVLTKSIRIVAISHMPTILSDGSVVTPSLL